MSKNGLVLAKRTDVRILLLRGKKVILDSHLAELYGVEVKHLNQQIKRNRSRFPGDFVFRLRTDEFESLRSQIVTSKVGRGGRRYLPLAFTEHGAIMARDCFEFQARDSDEHLRRARLCAHAGSARSQSADCRKTE